MNEQFIQRLSIDWNKIERNSYLREIDAIKELEKSLGCGLYDVVLQ